jgi:hypothetical protein
VQLLPLPITDNLALGKTATHYPFASKYPATKAVDGVLNPAIGNGGCSETLKPTTPMWWQVDLGVLYNVRLIFLYNRGDTKGVNTADFHIAVNSKVRIQFPFFKISCGSKSDFCRAYNAL